MRALEGAGCPLWIKCNLSELDHACANTKSFNTALATILEKFA
jgi:hypothetical protein